MNLKASKIATALVAAIAATHGLEAAVDVYFLRHGETPWNRARILQGSVPYTDLTAKGARMAEETAKGLGAAGISFGRIYTSPYLRARRTAEIISKAGAGPAPVEEPLLREMCFGKYEGVRYGKGNYPDDNLRRFFEEPENYVPQGDDAETFGDVGRRIRAFLEREIPPLDGKTERVLCVAHSLVLKSLVREIAGDGAPASAKKTLQRNCCFHVVRFDGGRFTLKDTGRVFYNPEDFDARSEPKMVAHRGAGDLTMPEASLPAYSNAVASANDIVKLDVQFTKDGVAVTGHDTSLARTMGWNVNIADKTYAELFARGRYLENGTPGPWRIVKLEEALEIVKPVPEMWIDFKSGKLFTPEQAEKTLTLVSDAGIDFSRIMVATFTRKALAYFRDKHPEIRRVGHFSCGNDTRAADANSGMANAIKFRDEYALYGLNMPVTCGQTRLEDIAELKGKGIWVSLWFVQDAECALRYARSGADAFVTDCVSDIRAALSSVRNR